MKILRPSKVPCNGCTACCQNDLIVLHPELGDRASEYLTMPIVNPLTGIPGRALQHKPEGGCVYLGSEGCTIHGRAPAICREFDCRKLVQRIGARNMRRAIADGLASQEVFDAGVQRASSLGRAA